MNPVRLAVAELRRLTASRLARLALAALVLIPTLYGGLYLYANHDPYGAFPQVPAAVVSDDTGTTLTTGEKLQVGGQVADHLVQSKSFDWHRVSHAEAMSGVDDGTYAFAVILPRTFSADLASTAEFTPRQATVVLETNDANNYMTSMIGNQVIKQVTASVASEVSQTAASKLLLGFSQVHDQLVKAVDGSEQLRAGCGQGRVRRPPARDGRHESRRRPARSRRPAPGDSTPASARRPPAPTTSRPAPRSSPPGWARSSRAPRRLPSQTDQLADGAEQVAAGNRSHRRLRQPGRDGLHRPPGSASPPTAPRLLAHLRAQGLTDAQLSVVESRLDAIDGYVGTGGRDDPVGLGRPRRACRPGPTRWPPAPGRSRTPPPP